MNSTTQKLELLQELLTLEYPLYSWSFDSNMNLISSNCPDSLLLSMLILLDTDRDAFLEKLYEDPGITIFRISLGLMWLFDFECGPDGKPQTIHAVGPAFFSEVSTRIIENNLEKLQISVSMKQDFVNTLHNIPVINLMRFAEYALMLHYCLTEEKLTANMIRFLTSEEANPKRLDQEARRASQHGTYHAEQKLLRMIEEGNLEFFERSQSLRREGKVGEIGNGSSLRSFKNLTIIYIALVSRAAIRGGLSEDISFTLSDKYINLVESANTFEELAPINKTMQEDYITRVHEYRTSTGTSSQIHFCRDYINMHLSEKITGAQLAEMVGYAPEYLPKLFKKEVGMSITDYANAQRIEQAKLMLCSPTPTIAEVGEALGFNSQSYFGKLFLRATGMSPAEYRKHHQNASL